MRLPHSDTLVFFGATGDLVYKKIFPALYAMERRGHLKVPVIGVARSDWTIEKFRARALASVKKQDGFDATVFAKFQKRLRYISGDYSAAATHAALRKELGKAAHPLHFLAIPPSVFAGVIKGLGQSGCARGARIIAKAANAAMACIWKSASFIGRGPFAVVSLNLRQRVFNSYVHVSILAASMALSIGQN